MVIRTGGKRVLESGTVIAYENNPILFEINNLTFTFHFIEKADQKSSSVTFHQTSNTSMRLDLVNFNQALGSSNSEPLVVGHINEQVLSLNFEVRALTELAQKILTYTWYVSDGEEVRNG